MHEYSGESLAACMGRADRICSGGTMRWNDTATCVTYMVPLQTDKQLVKNDSMHLSVVLLHVCG